MLLSIVAHNLRISTRLNLGGPAVFVISWAICKLIAEESANINKVRYILRIFDYINVRIKRVSIVYRVY